MDNEKLKQWFGGGTVGNDHSDCQMQPRVLNGDPWAKLFRDAGVAVDVITPEMLEFTVGDVQPRPVTMSPYPLP